MTKRKNGRKRQHPAAQGQDQHPQPKMILKTGIEFMSQTSWQERREFDERLLNGHILSASETARLIADADVAERSVAILEGLQEALKSQFGILLVDATTDDDEGEIRIELITSEEVNETSQWKEKIENLF